MTERIPAISGEYFTPASSSAGEITSSATFSYSEEKTLDTLFREDTLLAKKKSEEQIEASSPSVWGRICSVFSWWKKGGESKNEPFSPHQKIDPTFSNETLRLDPISPIPFLEPLREKESDNAFKTKELNLPNGVVSVPKIQALIASREELTQRIKAYTDLMALVIEIMKDELKLKDSKGSLADQEIKRRDTSKKCILEKFHLLQEKLSSELGIAKWVNRGCWVGSSVTFGSAMVGRVLPPALVITAFSSIFTGFLSAGQTYLKTRQGQFNKEISHLNFNQEAEKKEISRETEEMVSALDASAEYKRLIIELIRGNEKIRKIVLQKN